MTTKPVLLAVDDELTLLSAMERDLRREYGADFRIVCATSGSEALATLKQLKLRNEPVALLLVAQHIQEMTGVEFLEQAMDLFPDVKRVLLTASADTDIAIFAMNQVKLDYYLRKPWDPPEEHLYPVLKDLLADWQVAYRPPFEGLRLIGHRWAPNTYRLRDLLARNQAHVQWLDLDTSEERDPPGWRQPSMERPRACVLCSSNGKRLAARPA
jgi:thioredoxin reductase (NADPH)